MSGSTDGAADEQIRVSAHNKDRLKRRRRPGESFNDVIHRILDEDRDLLAGFGVADDRDVNLDDVHDETRQRSKDRISRFAAGRGEDEE
jgi:predicted CopG family antitoxin